VVFVAGVMAGLGSALLADPTYGHRRRAALRDRLAGRGRRGLRTARRVVRGAANVTRGAVAEACARACSGPVDDDVLVERVRARMGHAAHHPRGVEVTVAGGRVTLAGEVAPDEHAALVGATAEVPGVRGVVDRLVDVGVS
jgi:osmotically-inducible protein OsmY